MAIDNVTLIEGLRALIQPHIDKDLSKYGEYTMIVKELIDKCKSLKNENESLIENNDSPKIESNNDIKLKNDLKQMTDKYTDLKDKVNFMSGVLGGNEWR